MLSTMDEPQARSEPCRAPADGWSEINPSSYAVCKADMIVKGQPVDASGASHHAGSQNRRRRGGPGIYFYDDTGGSTGKVHVGFVGPTT